MEILTPSEQSIFTIKRGPIDNKKRELIIHPDYIRFESGNGTSNRYTKFDKDSIKEFRFGINWISGYKFTIGREYQIFIKNNKDDVLKINFKSFYGINKIDCHNLYADILGKLWDFYFRDIANGFLQKFWDKQYFTILDVIFSKENLRLKINGILKEEIKEIPWNKVQTRDYHNYFAIYSKDEAASKNKTFNYHDDWNSDVLYSVVKAIIKNIETETLI